MASLSTHEWEFRARLAAQPWAALDGLSEPLVSALARVLAGTPAERVLDGLLRQHRDWTAAQRRVVAEAVFGVGLWRRRLRAHVGAEAPASWLLASLLRDLADVPEAEACRLAGLTPGTLPHGPGPRDWAEALSVPDWLAAHLAAEVGEGEAQAFFSALATPGPVWLRTNLLRTSRAGLAERLREEGVETEPSASSPLGLRVVGPRPNILGLKSHQEGWFEVQDEGSQLLGLLLEARPGERVLDLCAGAGGKTLLLAGALAGQGRVEAWDVDRSRLERLALRAQRAGAAPTVRLLGAPPGEAYDAVLVDAPCSELGTLRRGPDLRWRLGPDALSAHLATQQALLEQAAGRVRPGGRLVYATCTVHRGENQALAEAFALRHPGFRRERPGEGWLPEAFVQEGDFVSLPHRQGTDGFYAAVFTRLR